MLARFTNRVLSSTILRGFEPCPLLELFRLLKVPRIAPMRFFQTGGFLAIAPAVVGGFAPRPNPLAPRSTSSRSVWILVGPPLPAPIGPSSGGYRFTLCLVVVSSESVGQVIVR